MINRYIEPYFAKNLRADNSKLMLLSGPRQTGKTTLVRKIAAQFEGRTLYLTGDDPTVRARLTDVGIEALRPVMEGNACWYQTKHHESGISVLHSN